MLVTLVDILYINVYCELCNTAFKLVWNSIFYDFRIGTYPLNYVPNEPKFLLNPTVDTLRVGLSNKSIT